MSNKVIVSRFSSTEYQKYEEKRCFCFQNVSNKNKATIICTCLHFQDEVNSLQRTASYPLGLAKTLFQVELPLADVDSSKYLTLQSSLASSLPAALAIEELVGWKRDKCKIVFIV